jgi:hypothetical protein
MFFVKLSILILFTKIIACQLPPYNILDRILNINRNNYPYRHYPGASHGQSDFNNNNNNMNAKLIDSDMDFTTTSLSSKPSCDRFFEYQMDNFGISVGILTIKNPGVSSKKITHALFSVADRVQDVSFYDRKSHFRKKKLLIRIKCF